MAYKRRYIVYEVIMTTSLGKQKIKTKFKTPKANIVKILAMTIVLEKVDFQK